MFSQREQQSRSSACKFSPSTHTHIILPSNHLYKAWPELHPILQMRPEVLSKGKKTCMVLLTGYYHWKGASEVFWQRLAGRSRWWVSLRGANPFAFVRPVVAPSAFVGLLYHWWKS